MTETITLPREVAKRILRNIEIGNKLSAGIEMRREIEAALEQPQVNSPEIPEGWKLVPVEPTTKMIDAARSQSSFPAGVWRAMLAAAPQPPVVEQPQGEQEPIQHDEDLLEKLYWEMDHQRSKTGDERLAFKGKMRFYASEFRARSLGRMAYAPSVSDEMMDLADRLGSEFDNVDPMAWKHLLVYAPKPPRQPLTEEEIAYCIFEARLGAEGAFKRNGSSSYRIARAIERAVCEKFDG